MSVRGSEVTVAELDDEVRNIAQNILEIPSGSPHRDEISVEVAPQIGDVRPNLLIRGAGTALVVDLDFGSGDLHFGAVVRAQKAVEHLAEAGQLARGVIVTNRRIAGRVKSDIEKLDMSSLEVSSKGAVSPVVIANGLMDTLSSMGVRDA
ncbi:hypothetical protein [Streptomyces abikoensis]|uniref:Uncharacterized protein n=1 Tax=Streptomyces abikoensis TaxID=97398 RepID=A0ABW7T9Y9_9ACTN